MRYNTIEKIMRLFIRKSLSWLRNGLVFVVINIATTNHASAKIATIPLNYYPEDGLYTISLNIGQQQKQTLEAVVDTGSAVLVLVPSIRHCTQCAYPLTKGHINPRQLKLNKKNATIKLSYGSTNDVLEEYEGAVGIDLKTPPVWMKLYLIHTSDQPISILGLVPHNIKMDPIHSTPFIIKMTNNFKIHTHLTFVLCGERGKSYLEFGSHNLSTKKISTKLLLTPFYEIGVSGFFNEQQQPIAKTKQSYAPAVLDTGTGGFIVLSERLYKPLYQYLYASSGKANQQLNKTFWNKNYCIPRTAVDFKSFPELTIGIAPINSTQPQYLKLPPTAYINRAGCPPDNVRLVFTSAPTQELFTAMRNQKARKAMGRTPEMIIGTSLFNHYAFTIQYQPEPMIHFIENERLCEISSNKISTHEKN